MGMFTEDPGEFYEHEYGIQKRRIELMSAVVDAARQALPTLKCTRCMPCSYSDIGKAIADLDKEFPPKKKQQYE